MQVVTVTDTDINVLNSKVGTVDYAKGRVTIDGFKISKYTGGYSSGIIKIFTRPSSTDIEGKREDVIRIREDDTTITVTELRL